jgi:hypothetical protein
MKAERPEREEVVLLAVQAPEGGSVGERNGSSVAQVEPQRSGRCAAIEALPFEDVSA